MQYFFAITSGIGSFEALHYENSVCDSTLYPDAAVEADVNVKLKFLAKLVEDPRVLQQISAETNRKFLY